ncbi:PhoPQ-activated pathogenicity-related family protein [Spirosoma pollinicola]|uniref:PhoPQ-activated pathogenicity-like protein PqaA type n=1 Tax=Spirosoma pollinicola TaxID=2057025 RepID=A0A2K8Z525_9BACT|nr:PhoPQ-activated protein PqaA family protein [Spirosoma pollinicola]AUD04996.1 PhoPQ-activated pathogenicity-like protein PqaA type [Spirosoma pollinicola]
MKPNFLKTLVLVGLISSIALFSFILPKPTDGITPATALESYLKNGDQSFKWEIKDTYTYGDITAYEVLLTSQKWREHIWKHQLTVMVPKEINQDGALLFITGGSIKDGEPRWNGHEDGFNRAMSTLATKNKAIVAVLRQTPNQPLYDNLTEDALITYTLYQFKKDGDYSWPLLFPMVKSAVRAMDAIQELAKQTLHKDVNRFVVSGASKRGWTTWLTGASDKRAVAIAPMVIDILNMPVNLDYQMKIWNKYSEQIEDYVKIGIPQTVHTKEGIAINEMIDPYSYRKKLTMPKMLFMGTNDEYWTVDAVKHYIGQIPGENFIHYVPNVGHDLGDKRQALEALSAFFGMTLNKQPYPKCQWTISTTKKGVDLTLKATPDKLENVIVWSANSTDMIFQDEKWSGKSLGIKNKATFSVNELYPASGYRAFYVDLTYKAPTGGTYTESTRMFLTDTDEVFLK